MTPTSTFPSLASVETCKCVTIVNFCGAVATFAGFGIFLPPWLNIVNPDDHFHHLLHQLLLQLLDFPSCYIRRSISKQFLVANFFQIYRTPEIFSTFWEESKSKEYRVITYCAWWYCLVIAKGYEPNPQQFRNKSKFLKLDASGIKVLCLCEKYLLHVFPFVYTTTQNIPWCTYVLPNSKFTVHMRSL